LARKAQKAKTSAEKLLEQAEGLEALAHLTPLIGLLGKSGREAAQALKGSRGLAAQARELTSLPGRFNAVMRPRGWIAYERMNNEVLRQATELAETGKVAEAEELLVESFDPDSLRFQIASMLAVQAFRPRDHLLQLAAADYEAGRYHAVVPVVLAQIDGIVADVVGRAVFTRTQDIAGKLVAWDSISAQDGGLPDLILLMASPRNRTTESPLEVPFRHGILHGRDLGYANRLVAAKTWAALFSLREWAIKYERGETEAPPVQPPPSLRQTLERMADVERQRRAIEAWRARPESGPLPEGVAPRPGTPEAAMANWLSGWRDRDFEAMESWTQALVRKLGNETVTARLAEMFGHRELARFAIRQVRDAAAAMTEVTSELHFSEGPPVLMTANLVFEDAAGNPLVRGAAQGRWGVNDVSALRQSPLDGNRPAATGDSSDDALAGDHGRSDR